MRVEEEEEEEQQQEQGRKERVRILEGPAGDGGISKYLPGTGG